MTRSKEPDYTLLGLTAALVIFGLLALTSASSVSGLHWFGDSYYFIKRQIIFGLIPGIIAAWILYRIPSEFWSKNATLIMILSLVLLVAVLIPGIGRTYEKNARSWISIFGLSFQPAEFVKLGLILFFSQYLVKHKERLMFWSAGFLPALTVGAIPVFLLMMQPDVGTASILFAIVFALLLFAGSRLHHLGALLLLGLASFGIMIFIAPYRLHRVTTFLHPELDPLGVGYQINQAYLAIGSGGFFGLGLGHSRQKFQYLPEVHADSIFAVIAEETGFVIIFLFLLLLYFFLKRMLFIAGKCPHEYERLVVCGIASWIGAQCVLNIAAIIGLLPLTGVPLPLVSHGGTSFMATLAGIGIVLGISRNVQLKNSHE